MNTSGARIFFIRKILLDIPRSFFLKFNIPETTLRNWEKSEILPKSKCDKMALLFFELNINVSSQWIYDGSGTSPVSCLNINATSNVLLDIETFKFNNKNAFVISSDNNYMNPLINKGDFIGGDKAIIEWKDERLYILKTKNEILIGFVQRLTQKQVSLRYVSSTRIKIVDFKEILAAYLITFIRKVRLFSLSSDCRSQVT